MRFKVTAAACALVIFACLAPSLAQQPGAPAKPKDDFLHTLNLDVVDKETGQGLANIPLTVRLDSGQTQTSTDDKGRAMINLLADQKYVGITCRPDGYVPIVLTWRNDQTKDPVPANYTLKMEKGTSIGGIVQDEAGKPIAGAKVNLIVQRKGDRGGMQRESISISSNLSIMTDEQGKWRYDSVPKDMAQPHIRLSHPEFLSDEMFGATPAPPIEKLRDFSGVMVMKKGVAIGGRVLDFEGQPVAGAEVMQGRDRFGSNFPSVKTDGSGAFQFAQARPNSDIVLTVKAKGYSPDLKTIRLGNEP